MTAPSKTFRSKVDWWLAAILVVTPVPGLGVIVTAAIARSRAPSIRASAPPAASVSPKPSAFSAGRVAKKAPVPTATRPAASCSATARPFESIFMI